MKKAYSSATSFRRALEERLRNKSRHDGTDIHRLRRQLSFDRLLSRFFTSDDPPWLLKGGYAMELRIHSARTTKDIDLSMRDFALMGDDLDKKYSTLLKLLQDAVDVDQGDYFSFIIGPPMQDLDAAPYGGARFPVTVIVDGRTFIKFHLDIGIGDIVEEPFEEFIAIDWLGFAGISSPKIKGISSEAQFSEKLHAYTLPRSEIQNSRVKDLIDLIILVNLGRMDKDRLRQNLNLTFERRKTHKYPENLMRPPEFWTPIYEKLAEESGIVQDIDEAFELLQKYVGSLT